MRVLLLGLAAGLLMVSTLRSDQRSTGVRRPNFEGMWNSATTTPLERPAQLKDKPFFTPAEAAEWDRQVAQRNEEPSPEAAAKQKGTGTYNMFYREWGTRTVKTRRTSIITDPPDGRIPELTPAAAEIKRRRLDGIKNGEQPEALGLQDRCLTFLTSGPPILPYSYNSNYQIVQTNDAIVVHAEMIHDARIIHLDGRPHLSPRIRHWAGDSIGRWEGNTLVVETTNFNALTAYRGAEPRSLRIVERFTKVSPDAIDWTATIEDPETWERPWTIAMPLTHDPRPVMPFECHEGNYGLVNILKAARAAER